MQGRPHPSHTHLNALLLTLFTEVDCGNKTFVTLLLLQLAQTVAGSHHSSSYLPLVNFYKFDI